MRILLFAFLCLLLNSCVSSKKFKTTNAAYDARIQVLDQEKQRQQDSITTLLFSLERSYGANDALLITQDKLQDRLAIKEDELDDLKGNLSSTSSRMSTELANLKREKADAEMAFDTLIAHQGRIIDGFQSSVKAAVYVIQDALDSVVAPQFYSISQSSGEVILSVQEDLLFQPRSTTRLKSEAAFIFKAIMDAMQSDPLLKLTIVGHTDNQPNPKKGTSNWEYAASRATLLADELAKDYFLSPNRLIAASHGEYGPATSNATEEGRRTNRRIDFVLRNNVGNLLRELNRLNDSQKTNN